MVYNSKKNCGTPISKIVCVLSILAAVNKGSATTKVNWFDAQEHCKSTNSTLTILTSVPGPSYWTARYQRISQWIKLLGCFEEADVTSNADENTTMEYSSAGFCQEICTKSNKTIFAIKNRTCLCLTERVRRNGRNTSECNFTCTNHIDGKFTEECGGVSAFNVFRSKKDINCPSTSEPGDCLAIQCINGDDPRYFCENCTSSLNGVCQLGDSSSLINNKSYTSWENSMKVCKNDHSGYLHGSLPLLNASKACKKINETVGSPTWVGAARQMFQGTDQGYSISSEEKSNFIKCEICRKNNLCSFVNCTTEAHSVVCSDDKNFTTVIFFPTSRTTGGTRVTETTITTKEATITTTTTETTGTTDHLKNSTRNPIERKATGVEVSAIVIPIILIVFGSILGGTGFICWRQMKAKKVKEPVAEKQAGYLNANQIENDHAHHEENNVCNSSYFILEPKSSYEEFGIEIPQTENTYIEAKEEEYDHLGNSKQRRKVTDFDNYDETTKTENLKKETEEGNYDHLGNAPSRSNIVEDTYCHASPNHLDSSSDYDVANHTEHKDTENTYDHTGAVMNLQNDSNYDYSELKR